VRALVHDPAAPFGLRPGDAPDPVPSAGEALVEVASTSLNFGELDLLAERTAPGGVAGWDAAGIVVRAAADGSGPPAGARVATYGPSGAWAELRAVDTDEMAVVPDGVDLGEAGALPVAGVTALRALRALGPIGGRRILVTGASGGVGRFAVQLAARAGAEVIASVGRPDRGAGLTALGAARVVVGLDGVPALAAVIDTVGGPQLGAAFLLLEEGGSALWVGNASRQPVTLDLTHPGQRGKTHLSTFDVGGGLGPDLAHLVGLLAAGALDPQVGWRGSWERVHEGAEALLSRRVAGKAVLDVARPPRPS
jgi:NADPH2:quinone reductase